MEERTGARSLARRVVEALVARANEWARSPLAKNFSAIC
jgi:hypothetical protein